MTIVINKEVLQGLNPSKERLERCLGSYPDFNGSWEEFLNLSTVELDDKMWVARRLLNENQLTTFSVLCARAVLHIHENNLPNNKKESSLANFTAPTIDLSSLSIDKQEKLKELESAAAAVVCTIRESQSALNIIFLKIAGELK